MVSFTESSSIGFARFDPGPEPPDEEYFEDLDVVMTVEENSEEIEERDVMEHDPVSNIQEERLIIAIDFGTTFSSVAYVVLPKGLSPEHIDVRKVKCIGNYPGYESPPGGLDRQDVPTELWYDDGHVRNRGNRRDDGAINSEQFENEGEEASSSESDESENEQSEFEDDGGLEESATIRPGNAKMTSATQYWGFGVQQRLGQTHIPRDEARPLTRFKLNLDQKGETNEVRDDLGTILQNLKKRRIIQSHTDIYTHYLTHLLKHTKDQLLSCNQLQSNMFVQFVLCVPAKWPMKACRIMQTALEEAVTEAGLSERADCGVHNMFMISEPEAAAECILAEARSELYFGETTVIVDAGGGTVDAVTYKCKTDAPLRLSEEVVAPDSKLCGASYINERFEKKLLKKLANETYLVKNTKTLKSIVQARTLVFENNDKRKFDASDRKTKQPFRVYIDDLRENSRKNFFPNVLELKRKTMKDIFEESLDGVREVLENQLDLAEAEGHHVQKVILTGGFSQSPSLRSYLRAFLADRRDLNGKDIELIVPENPSTAVARGAVLRALNKRLGPSRITQCSYGFLMSELFDPENCEAHRGTRCRINAADGERYVDGTIFWVIQAGDKVANMQEFSFTVRHTFPLTKKKLVCAEQLFMSDQRHVQHYRKTHILNKGAEMVGMIEADLSLVRDMGLIEPQLPSEMSVHSQKPNSKLSKRFWEIHYEVALIVEGRSIRFEARYPVKDELMPGEVQKVLAMKLVGIAAAFQPGTA